MGSRAVAVFVSGDVRECRRGGRSCPRHDVVGAGSWRKVDDVGQRQSTDDGDSEPECQGDGVRRAWTNRRQSGRDRGGT